MLEGKLVTLRSLEQTDLDRSLTWANDAEVTQYLTSLRYPVSRADEERWLDDAPRNGLAGGVRLAIDTKGGEHIGSINLHRAHPEDSKAGLGIMIGDKSHWSQGYGTDAIVTLLRFAFHEMNLHRVWLQVLEDNERAITCYRQCGFQEEVRLRQEVFRVGHYWDVLTMGILRNEFEALHGAPATAGAEV